MLDGKLMARILHGQMLRCPAAPGLPQDRCPILAQRAWPWRSFPFAVLSAHINRAAGAKMRAPPYCGTWRTGGVRFFRFTGGAELGARFFPLPLRLPVASITLRIQ